MNNLKTVCSHPITIFSVDDNQKFFNIIRLGVSSLPMICEFSDNSQNSLHYLKDTYVPNSFIHLCVSEQEDQSSDKRNLEIDIRAIRKQVFNSKRFSEIGIVILDYAMPGLNGGEIATQLKQKPFKIILLTGEADSQTAIELFNDSVIHSYIRKDDPQFKILLDTTIRKLQQDYFQELSQIVINSLEQYPDFPHFWYKDPVFKKLFDQIYLENKLIEFYLLDEYGSYLFLDTNGNPSWLGVTTEEMMETYEEYAEGHQAPSSVIDAIKSRKMMPFFFSDDDLQIGPPDWEKYLHPAKVLQGKETYYYSYITDPQAYELEGSILSYNDFLKQQD